VCCRSPFEDHSNDAGTYHKYKMRRKPFLFHTPRPTHHSLASSLRPILLLPPPHPRRQSSNSHLRPM